jgi:hypothetical protein
LGKNNVFLAPAWLKCPGIFPPNGRIQFKVHH